MPSYDLTGTIKLITDQQTFDSGFAKREFVVTTEGERYPQEIKFECVKDKCSLLDNMKPGQRVKVAFDLRGNEYKERYYVNLTAWRIEEAGADEEAGPMADDGPPIESLVEPEPEADADALPF